jgi:hypothetical protein
MTRYFVTALAAGLLFGLAPGCGGPGNNPAADAAFEKAQTEKLLGVPVQDFPLPQGPDAFDELPADRPDFDFAATERPLSGPKPRPWFETRSSVLAKAPDGTVYEAYCGDGRGKVAPGHRFTSTLANRRHRYGGDAYHPHDVFVGKHDSEQLHPLLFFRDVGSHNTAPHHMAIDGDGRCHLAVADVDIYEGNRLHLYWVIGRPQAGR